MELFPAIDLIDGCVVRLFQGDYEQKIEFGKDPLLFAQKFEEEGAKNLHLVDLDGAKAGSMQNFDVLERIAKNTNLFIEVGGGIRTEDTILRCLNAGAGRVILGTSALRDPSFTQSMLEQFGDKIAIGVDAKDGKVAIEGWLELSDIDSFEFCQTMHNMGANYIIYTDIAKDGAQNGINEELYAQLNKIDGLNITASGGVSSLQDIKNLNNINLYAAIIGKALYTNSIQLPKALKIAHGGIK